MSTIKPIVEERSVFHILASHFSGPVTELRGTEGGLIAQTFIFRTDEKDYVIRFNADNMDANFEKERYIAAKYNSSDVPIPEVIDIGRLHKLHYCITPRIVGEHLDRLSPEDISLALPSVINTLNAIHDTDIGQPQGYGLFDGQGQGFFSDWSSNLTYVKDEERSDGFYGKWHNLFKTSFLDRQLFDRVYGQMEGLLICCPNKKYLVHGGYGFGNLLINKGQVSAVLDWIDSKYGDPLYDVAWLDYWDAGRGYRDIFRADYKHRAVDMSGFDERLLCYQCYIALDSMRFFAKSDDHGGYRWTTDRIEGLIGNRRVQ
ncbi:MAG: aminoglycoside phosphotransferase family protein [Candidatus Aegiribacteria sp.]|nr:aminoglycoside phosphotransferase family protein [Candidatus Aegiribacteria sp.]